jgi:hypothetical protein
MRRVLVVLGLMLLSCGIASAATCSRYDVTAGYTFVHTPIAIATQPSGTGSGTGSTTHLNFNGWNAGGEAKITCMFAIAGEVSGVYNTPPGSNTRVNIYDYLFGPRIFWPNSSMVTPFGEVLLGGAHASSGSYSNNAFGAAFGGGVDVGITHSLAIRGRVDYLLTEFGNNTHQNNTNVSVGVVFRFGGGG